MNEEGEVSVPDYTYTEDSALKTIAQTALEKLRLSFEGSEDFGRDERATGRGDMSTLKQEEVQSLISIRDSAASGQKRSEVMATRELGSILAEMASREMGITVPLPPPGISVPSV